MGEASYRRSFYEFLPLLLEWAEFSRPGSGAFSWEVGPIPNSGRLLFKFQQAFPDMQGIELSNVQGKVIWTYKIKESEIAPEMEIQLPDWVSSGTYFISLIRNENRSRRKILLTR